ncbi:MAG: hypothetical protein PHP45_11340 [Elusimicrobiales bacterium]|nr:hypothetical protein [Elusimicrobiales bacterium]
MKSAGVLFRCLVVLAICAAVAAAEATPVINSGGYLALSDGTPLGDYRSDEALLKRYHDLSDPCIKEVERDETAAMQSAACRQITALALAKLDIKARKMKAERPALRDIPTEELAGVARYVGHGYKSTNSSLWNGVLPSLANTRDMMMLMLSAMNRLPDYKGGAVRADFYLATETVDVPDREDIERRAETYRSALRRGSPFIPRSFWSASWVDSAHYAPANKECTALTLEIESRTGKNISIMADDPGEEREVLFRPGTKFEVVSVSEPEKFLKTKCNPLGYGYTVRLRELP